MSLEIIKRSRTDFESMESGENLQNMSVHFIVPSAFHIKTEDLDQSVHICKLIKVGLPCS